MAYLTEDGDWIDNDYSPTYLGLGENNPSSLDLDFNNVKFDTNQDFGSYTDLGDLINKGQLDFFSGLDKPGLDVNVPLPDVSKYDFGNDPNAFSTYLNDFKSAYDNVTSNDSGPLGVNQGSGTDLSKTLSNLLGTKVGGLGSLSDIIQAALTTAKAYGAYKNLTSPQGVPKFAPRASTGTAVNWGRGSLAAPVQRKAEGGAVEGGLGTLRQGLHSMAVAQGLIPGGEDGQSDQVPILASPGEYVFDAESVSMLGNGNTEAGAKMLDEMRQSLREHKRSAGPGEIAPASGSIEQYLGGR